VKNIGSMSQAELAAFVQTHLEKRGIKLVLSGGAAVSFYVGGLYVSKDIDLIADWPPKTAALNDAMAEIGFHSKGKYFSHPETEEIVEILPGPISAGEEHITKSNEVQLSTGTLKLLWPTDCVKERLAGFFYWNDTQSFEQAILVSQKQKVNISDVKYGRLKRSSLKNLQYSLMSCESGEKRDKSPPFGGLFVTGVPRL
jgi:hypothetical protein